MVTLNTRFRIRETLWVKLLDFYKWIFLFSKTYIRRSFYKNMTDRDNDVKKDLYNTKDSI